MKVTYGSLEARNENDLYNILAKEDKEIFVSAKPLLKMGYWDGTSALPAQASFTIAPELSEIEMHENALAGTVQYGAHFGLTANTNAFLRSMNAEATYLTKSGFVARTTEMAGNISDYSFDFSTANTSDAEPVQFMYNQYFTAGAQYNLAFTLSLGPTISFIGNPTIS